MCVEVFVIITSIYNFSLDHILFFIFVAASLYNNLFNSEQNTGPSEKNESPRK